MGPNNYTIDEFENLLNESGFQGRYDVEYLPMDMKKDANYGYAFINFISRGDALEFSRSFEGFNDWGNGSTKRAAMGWAEHHQGQDEFINRYRNSPVMHEDVPDKHKPRLFRNGLRIKFPAPTKKILPP